MLLMEDKDFSHEESLRLINTMINKARNSYHDTGVGPMLWGSVVGICGFVSFLRIQLGFQLPFDIWLLTVVAILPQVYLGIKASRTRRVKAYEEDTMDALWICFGIGIFILSFISSYIMTTIKPILDDYADRHGSRPAFGYSSISTAFFLLWYGFPTIVTGVLRSFKPMLAGGILCWILCIVSVFTPLKIDMLLTSVAAIFAWLIPGIILWRRFQKRKVAHGV
jgi:hypothetical protein